MLQSQCSYFRKVQFILNAQATKEDKRAKISSIDFISALLISFRKETYKKYLEGMNRYLFQITGQKLSRSTFWERLETKKLQDQLIQVFMDLVKKNWAKKADLSLLKTLNIRSIYAFDASTISLPQAARKHFQGTRTNKNHSALKWQCLYDIINKTVNYSKITNGKDNDYNFLPVGLENLNDSLLLFDLAYVGKKNLKEMTSFGIKYLCRLRYNMKGYVIDPMDSNRAVRRLLNNGIGMFDPEDFTKNVGKFVKLRVLLGNAKICEKYPEAESFVYGVWNDREQKYHWYLSNMDIEPKLIYPLYALRWQIELFFKTSKSYLNLGGITTANKRIILNLILLSLISYMIMMPMIGLLLGKDIYNASVLRIGVFLQKIEELIIKILQDVDFKENIRRLLEVFELWREQLFDPNSAKRQSSIILINSMILNG